MIIIAVDVRRNPGDLPLKRRKDAPERCDIEPAAHVSDAPLRLGADFDIIDLLRSEILERREHCAESWRVDAPGPVPAADRDRGEDLKNGRESGRERVGQYVKIKVVAGALNNK